MKAHFTVRNSQGFAPLHTLLTASFALGASGIAAQEDLTTADTSSPRFQLEEVLVTARKREEKLQEIALSVSAMGEQQISNGYFRDLRDIEGMSPNLIIDHISAAPGSAAISLRGINFQDLEKSFEPTVGVVLDGIFLGTNTGNELQIFDMERIEVLRGPQGTLFGRNTIGGVINVISTNPTGQWGVKARGRLGNYERTDGELVLNFPLLVDTLAGKATYVTRKQDKGYFENQYNGKDEATVDYQSWSLDLLWNVTDNLSLEYIYRRQDDDSETGPILNASRPANPTSGHPGDDLCVNFGRCQLGTYTPETGDKYKSNQNYANFTEYNANAHTLELNWALGDSVTMSYLFGLIDSDEDVQMDFDATDIEYFESKRVQDYKQYSHELRFSGSVSDLDYVVGGYLWHSDYQLDQKSFHLFGLIPGGFSQAFTDFDTDSWAVFAEADWHFTEQWTLTLGGRYTRDKKKMQRSADTWLSPTGPSIPGFSTFSDATGYPQMAAPTEDSWSKFTPKLSLKYQWSDNMMVYGTYSQGYRSGGLNGRANTLVSAVQTYDPETLTSYELGMKSSWLENRLQLNAAIFYQDYQDKQEDIVIAVPPPIGQETITVNAAEATIPGAELELLALPVDGWTLGFNVGYLDAKYEQFDADVGLGGVTDNSDLKLRRTPEWTWSLNSVYEWGLGPGIASVQGSYSYRDEFETEFLNIPEGHVKGFGTLDASVNYELDRWRFSLFGRNLSNEDQVSTALNVAGNLTFQAFRQPRTYGLEVTYMWN